MITILGFTFLDTALLKFDIKRIMNNCKTLILLNYENFINRKKIKNLVFSTKGPKIASNYAEIELYGKHGFLDNFCSEN